MENVNANAKTKETETKDDKKEKPKKFNIITRTENLIDYIYLITEKSPRRTWTDIIPMLRTKTLSLIEYVHFANDCSLELDDERKSRDNYQRNILNTLKTINSILEIAKKRKYINKDQFNVATEKVFKLMVSIFKWKNSDAFRTTFT